MKISGIYQIQSKSKPNRIYVGSSVCISKRWVTHLTALRLNKHENSKLQNHFNKYGIADFRFSVLLGCDKVDLIKTEQYFIDSYNPYFNICKIAGNCSGRIITDETRRKMSLAAMGKKKRLGTVLSEETRRKISNSLKGKKQSEETRKKQSDARKGSHVNLGCKHTDEQKEKAREMSIRLGNKPPSAKGLKRSDETKKKMSLAKSGRVISIETKQKLSESVRKYYIRKNQINANAGLQ